jgi:hypothetical protein
MAQKKSKVEPKIKCAHGKELKRCRDCRELRETQMEIQSRTEKTNTDLELEIWGAGHCDSGGGSYSEECIEITCETCKIAKPRIVFYDHDLQYYWDTCNSCRIEVPEEETGHPEEETGHPEEETGGLQSLHFLEEQESKFYCFDCRDDLPVSRFPPGMDVSQVTYCLECQQKNDHTPVFPCIGDCGRFVRPDLQDRAVCEECKARPGLI